MQTYLRVMDNRKVDLIVIVKEEVLAIETLFEGENANEYAEYYSDDIEVEYIETCGMSLYNQD